MASSMFSISFRFDERGTLDVLPSELVDDVHRPGPGHFTDRGHDSGPFLGRFGKRRVAGKDLPVLVVALVDALERRAVRRVDLEADAGEHRHNRLVLRCDIGVVWCRLVVPTFSAVKDAHWRGQRRVD